MKNKVNLLAVDMGYGHQRAAYPLLDISYHGIIMIDNYKEISESERKIWESGRKTYEKISSFKKIPIVGDLVFFVMNSFQKIDKFYPKRDLSKNTSQQLYFYKKIKDGLGKELINQLSTEALPIISTFFVSIYFAEYYNYSGDVYAVICDSDISRAWAPINIHTNKTVYFAPTERVVERLQLYGVNKKNIKLTGFPLPKENIGEKQEIVKKDFGRRLAVLDPQKKYYKKYKETIKKHLGKNYEFDFNRSIVITFAVGGAGAQKEIGEEIIKSLYTDIQEDRVKVNLIAGSRNDVYSFFKKVLEQEGLQDNKNVKIIYHKDKIKYFKLFNKIIRNTDVLWTKPSELSFYSALGLPIIISHPIGFQEDYNKDWLIKMGAGIKSGDPRYVHEWLFDWINNGYLAQAAMNGFLNVERMGTYNIEKIVLNKK